MLPRILILLILLSASLLGADRPNVLWFVVDDMSADFGCYGQNLIATPHLDRLAREGTLFRNAFVTAPVCSPSRSALITGMYQTSIGAHHHRSGRGELKIRLPEGVAPVPALLQKAGYHTCIGSGLQDLDYRGLPFGAVKVRTDKTSAPRPADRGRIHEKIGKTDYNFEWDPSMYDSHDWAARRPGQPFFMQVQLHGGKLREGNEVQKQSFRARVVRELGSGTDPSKVELPPYYPRDPVLLQDWADYLDAVRLTDIHVGRVLERLEKEGILDQTLVVFMTDHGISHARGKQFLYNEGTHIPLVIRGPGVPTATVREDLVEHIDLAALSLAAANLKVPAHMQARDILSAEYQPRGWVFAARDRCDETTENLRSIRTSQHLYIRNAHPGRPHLQPNAYKDGKAIVQRLKEMHLAGKLPPLTELLLFSAERPGEELYDWRADPWQLQNLAANPTHRATLETLRKRMDTVLTATRDPAPETEAQYDSDMKVYLHKPNPEVESNIRLMKQWASEGR